MNLKTTPILFGLLLGILWLFGLVLVYTNNTVDAGLLVPSLRDPDIKIDLIKLQYRVGEVVSRHLVPGFIQNPLKTGT